VSIPTKAGPDTVCRCNHWWEEHLDGCAAPGCECPGFVFDPAANTPDAVADRGGDPDYWPHWVKEALGYYGGIG